MATIAAPEPSTLDAVADEGSRIVYLDGESTVLKVALRRHDRVCRQHSDCPRRVGHAVEGADKVREVLGDRRAEKARQQIATSQTLRRAWSPTTRRPQSGI